MTSNDKQAVLSIMLAVLDTPAAVEWYQKALGARLLWSLGSVAGLQIQGAPFFLHEPVEKKGFASPLDSHTVSARVELFVDDPDSFIAGALNAGASGSLDDLRDHEVSWGLHRQGSFTDPFGHIWLVGDKSPLKPYPG